MFIRSIGPTLLVAYYILRKTQVTVLKSILFSGFPTTPELIFENPPLFSVLVLWHVPYRVNEIITRALYNDGVRLLLFYYSPYVLFYLKTNGFIKTRGYLSNRSGNQFDSTSSPFGRDSSTVLAYARRRRYRSRDDIVYS